MQECCDEPMGGNIIVGFILRGRGVVRSGIQGQIADDFHGNFIRARKSLVCYDCGA
jgi:hypothetical protein